MSWILRETVVDAEALEKLSLFLVAFVKSRQ